MIEFRERTIKVTIDTSKCSECETKACIDACKKFARGILQLKDGKPSLEHLTEDEVIRRGTECLACEYECWFRGKSAIKIDVPIEGLDEYLRKRGLLEDNANQ
ncbi:hypothetical protein [Moorella sulfitireducens (nom. illeg.)]|uniref:hypothetical protein n=1 Tax=Neomoorella sulfitireducens TaxID=2972948 RepID=UPI0021AD1148|nr:hypothetical protein [Moorella sulfitireducens]